MWYWTENIVLLVIYTHRENLTFLSYEEELEDQYLSKSPTVGFLPLPYCSNRYFTISPIIKGRKNANKTTLLKSFPTTEVKHVSAIFYKFNVYSIQT